MPGRLKSPGNYGHEAEEAQQPGPNHGKGRSQVQVLSLSIPCVQTISDGGEITGVGHDTLE